MIKILNLYAGIGGNRKLWSGDIEVTAIENVPEIAKIYQDFFPQDKVIVTDAHQFLLEHYQEFDFIWSSPPCPSHSRLRAMNPKQNKPIFPDMKLYEEIIFLQKWFKGKWVVENVKPYYKPLISAIELQRHLFWSNFNITPKEFERGENIRESIVKPKQDRLGFDLSPYRGIQKVKILRNCVVPEVGLYIFQEMLK
jgi:DNA (cytosine-5)-methyltransferase 1